jgi:type IV secretory pathway VirB2 component (pilin)
MNKLSRSSKLKIARRTNRILVAMVTLLLSSSAFAAGGLSKISDFFNNLNDVLNAVSIVAVTVAVMFSGYEMAYGSGDKRKIATVLIGGVIIGAAAQIANMVVGT